MPARSIVSARTLISCAHANCGRWSLLFDAFQSSGDAVRVGCLEGCSGRRWMCRGGTGWRRDQSGVLHHDHEEQIKCDQQHDDAVVKHPLHTRSERHQLSAASAVARAHRAKRHDAARPSRHAHPPTVPGACARLGRFPPDPTTVRPQSAAPRTESGAAAAVRRAQSQSGRGRRKERTAAAGLRVRAAACRDGCRAWLGRSATCGSAVPSAACSPRGRAMPTLRR